MSAECNRCGWDLPYEGDCVACDENGTFKNQLGKYETAYNNLRLLTRSQYDDIDSLTGERNEAQRKLTMCSETLRDADEVKETAQRERDEALADIDEMRAEGCAAVGVLENIFNGVTAEGVNHGDRTIAKTACVAAEALVNVPRCEHKEELSAVQTQLKLEQASFRDCDRWLIAAVASSAGYKARLEALRDLLPAIIFGVVYYDLGEHGITWKVCAERWEAHWKPSLLQEHSGDCTDECHSCARCQAEDVMALVDIVRKGLDDGE